MIEILRRQMLWILFLVMGMYALLSIALRQQGMESPGAATFMLNLGLTLASVLSQLLTALLALRQFPTEMENRTIYPLLAKPLERETLLLGKWLACSLGGLLVYGMFFVLVWLSAPPVNNLSGGMLLQLLTGHTLLLGWVSAFALALSLWLPRGLSHVIILLCVFLSETLVQWGGGKWPILHALPRFGGVDLTTRFADGIPALSGAEALGLSCYVGLWIALCLLCARHLFVRRAL